MALWARHKAAFGWHPRAFELSVGTAFRTNLLILLRNLSGKWQFAYVPHGPETSFIEQLALEWDTGKGFALQLISARLKQFLGSNVVFIRWDLDWIIARQPSFKKESDLDIENSMIGSTRITGIDNHPRRNFELPPLTRAGSDVQPPDTVLIELSQGAEAIMAGMKAKTRYNVRLAEKKGVEIAVCGVDYLSRWYAMYRETAIRDQIALHSEKYYQTLLEQNPASTELLIAIHDGDLLAGIIMFYTKNQAIYLYGASSNIKRNLMPAYLLQWRAINHAIARGCSSYDSFGIPPSADTGHPMHGLYQFKTGFGGEVISYPGCWDSPTRTLLYRIYRLAEKFRYYYFKKIRKR